MKKILVVEDEEDMVNMLRLTLENAGYEVVTAANGEEGLEMAVSEVPDLVISDILMPVMDGFAFLKELRKHKVTARIPVLILTARGQMEDAFKAVGVEEFIEKPSETQELLDKIQLLVKGKSKADFTVPVKTRVLIAGNKNDVLRQMQDKLQLHSCEIKIVYNGAEIVTEVVRFAPEIVIMDVQMPGLESAEAIRILRLLPEFRSVTIMVYSYYHVEDLGSEVVKKEIMEIENSQNRCMNAGANEYLGRFNVKSFMMKVNRFLS